jgi:hypothetical protein
MKFGKVPEIQLNTIHFSLPSEPAGNKKILGGVRASRPAVYVGCPQWGLSGVQKRRAAPATGPLIIHQGLMEWI